MSAPEGRPPPEGAPPQGPKSPDPGPQSPPAGPQSPAYDPGPQSSPYAPGGQPAYGGPPPQAGWAPPPGPASGQLADWGTRLAATLIDALLWFVATLVLGVVVGIAFGLGSVAADSEGIAIAGSAVNVLLGLILYAAYTGYLMARPGARNGQTLGKQAMSIRVVRTDGAPVNVGTVAVRHWVMKYIVFGYVAAVTLYLATLLNYLWPLWDGENRALHDMVASTRVVRA